MQSYNSLLVLTMSLFLSNPIFAEDIAQAVFPIPNVTPTVYVTQCGELIENQNAVLVKNLECASADLNADAAAISLNNASLNLNGKTITLNNALPSGNGIFIYENSDVYDLTSQALISGFEYGVKVQGNHNVIQQLMIENTIYGLFITGNHNRIARVTTENIGGIIDIGQSLLVAEARGILIYGNHNQLHHNTTQNIGYAGNQKTTINSMFINSYGILLDGNHNTIQHHNAENIYASSYAVINAQSTARGIYVNGNNNLIENSNVSKIYSKGFRSSTTGSQTGGSAAGVYLTNSPDSFGGNTVSNSSIQEVFAEGESLGNDQPKDVTAEAFGIVAIYYNHSILNNNVQRVDAKAPTSQRVAGIRAVDDGHIIRQNQVEYNGKKAAAGSDSLLTLHIEGISIDGFNMLIERNYVKNNFGSGIIASFPSIGNNIHRNVSQANAGFDYAELATRIACRNNWGQNYLHNAKFFPRACFE